MTKSVGILGLGRCIPDKVMTNADLEKIVDTTNEWIIERTGIKERRIAEPEVTTADLAEKAALQALADAKVAPEEIDMIILATATPNHAFPSTACIVQNRIGAVNAAAFDISAGCSGFVYCLCLATGMIKSGIYNKILIIGAETLSKITNWTDRNTCVLFGDGAGAAVVGEVEEGYGVLGLDMGADGSGAGSLYQPAGGSAKPACAESVANNEHTIVMHGSEVFKFAVRVLGKTADKALANAGMTANDVDLLVPHQANIRIITSAAKRLKLPMEKVFVNLEKYANTSAASIPNALFEAQAEGRLKKGMNVLLDGFGAGLTWCSVVMKWNKD